MIRAPGLIDPAVAEAADNARLRGVGVVLIDDSRTTRFDTAGWQQFLDAATTEIGAAPAGATVTVRLAPDHGRHAATIVTTCANETLTRREFGAADNPACREP